MKTAVIFAEGIKQIMFTPENDDEKFALSLITPTDDIEMVLTNGNFGDQRIRPFAYTINECQGGYLRIYSDENSKILVIRPKRVNKTNE